MDVEKNDKKTKDIQTSRMTNTWKTKEALEGPASSWDPKWPIGLNFEVLDDDDDDENNFEIHYQ